MNRDVFSFPPFFSFKGLQKKKKRKMVKVVFFQLGLFPQLTAFIVCAGLKWSYIKGLSLGRVDALLVGAAQQGDSYLSQLLAAAASHTK